MSETPETRRPLLDASVAEGGVVEFGAVEGLTGGGAGKVCHVPVPQVGSRHTDEAAKAAGTSVGFLGISLRRAVPKERSSSDPLPHAYILAMLHNAPLKS